MKINELLTEKGVQLNVSAANREEAVSKLIGLLDAQGCISDKAAFKEGILAREKLSTTAVGGGIAIPHAKVEAVKKAGIAAITVPAGVDYNAPDKKPVTILFMIAAPASGSDIHLKALQRLAVLLAIPGFQEELQHAKNAGEFLDLISKKEAEKFPESQAPATEEKSAPGHYRVLAVTACPTGIAHTFMAAEKLTQQAKKWVFP